MIQPRSRAELVAAYRTGEPFVVHGAPDAAAALAEVPFLASLDVLLSSWPATIQVHLPDVADEASSITASPEDARKLFATGMGLLFDEAQRFSPVLAAWLAVLRRDLGLSALTQGRCLMYATPAGGGTAPHFDQNANFVLQLHGSKTWWLAPNLHVDRPLTRHTAGLPIDPELATYAMQPLPTVMPAERRAIVLEPGSLLFVPRGTWHATQAGSDALALNFTYTSPTWIDLFSAALRSRLALSSGWRQTAAPASVAELEALLRELALDVPNWTAVDILDATESEPG